MKRRKLMIAAALVGLLGLVAWFAWDRLTAPTPPHIPLEGVSEDRATLIKHAIEGVRRQPRSGETWGELSMVLVANGFMEQAIPCFAQAHRFDPRQPRWPYFHGALLLLYGRREGFSDLREAATLTRSPDERAAVLFPLAQALVEDGQLDEAQQCLRNLQEIEGDSPGVHFGLGLLAYGKGDRAGAREHLSKLTDHPAARKRVCSILAGLVEGDEKLAEHYRQRAAQLPDDQPWPGSFETEMLRYRSNPERRLAPYYELEAQGRRAEAVEFLRQYVAQSPDEGSCMTLGVALLTREEFKEAAAAFRQALQFNPKNVKANLFLGSALVRQGEKSLQAPDTKDQAQEVFRQAVLAEDNALSLQKDLPHAHLTRGQALKYLGRTEESLQALREAVLVASESAEMHQALGEALAEAGQFHEAMEHLENAVQFAKPEDPKPRQALEKWKGKIRGSP